MNKNPYKSIIVTLLRDYRISVIKWTNTPFNESDWEADFYEKKVIIPEPENELLFFCCLHEIGHVVQGPADTYHEQEYLAERWAIETGEYIYNISSDEYRKHAKNWINYNIRIDIELNKIKSFDDINDDIKSFLKTL